MAYGSARSRERTLLSCVWLGLIALCFNAQALVFRVTDTQDGTNKTSLRGAIIEANRVGGNNAIILGTGTYSLSIKGADEEAGYTGDLNVTNGRLTIIGSRPGVTISAEGLGDRVFQISPGATLRLFQLAVTGGQAPDGDGYEFTNRLGWNGENGGGLLNKGSLQIHACAIYRNSAGAGAQLGSCGSGGAIWNSGAMSIHECTITNNAAGDSLELGNGGAGGGIYSSGRLIAHRCLISGNFSGAGGLTFSGNGNGGPGGAICNEGTMILTRCTLSSNACRDGGSGLNLPGGRNPWGLPGPTPGGHGGQGGAICNTAKLFLKKCHISASTCGNGGVGVSGGLGGAGGAIYNSGELQIEACRFSSNASGKGGPGLHSAGEGGCGGGICNLGKTTLRKSVLLANTCGDGADGKEGFTSGAGATGGSGGGIFNQGSIWLVDCVVTQNKAGNGGSGGATFATGAAGAPGGNGGSGGGIFNAAGRESAQICGSEVMRNLFGTGGLGGAGGPAGFLPGPLPGGLGGPYVPDGPTGVQGPDGSGQDFFGDFMLFP